MGTGGQVAAASTHGTKSHEGPRPTWHQELPAAEARALTAQPECKVSSCGAPGLCSWGEDSSCARRHPARCGQLPLSLPGQSQQH